MVFMTLRPTDMLEIQSAIDAYERKFPHRAAPTAEVALAWRLGKKEWARRQAAAAKAAQEEQLSDAARPDETSIEVWVQPAAKKPVAKTRVVHREGNGLLWLLAQLRLRWLSWCDDLESSEAFEDSTPLVKGALRVGMYGMAAVLVASVFLLGVIVG
jgi:hypothetical protein